jgi:hypothetical protein
MSEFSPDLTLHYVGVNNGNAPLVALCVKYVMKCFMSLINAFNTCFTAATFNPLLSNVQHKPVFCHVHASDLPDDTRLYWATSVSTFPTNMCST